MQSFHQAGGSTTREGGASLGDGTTRHRGGADPHPAPTFEFRASCAASKHNVCPTANVDSCTPHPKFTYDDTTHDSKCKCRHTPCKVCCSKLMLRTRSRYATNATTLGRSAIKLMLRSMCHVLSMRAIHMWDRRRISPTRLTSLVGD